MKCRWCRCAEVPSELQIIGTLYQSDNKRGKVPMPPPRHRHHRHLGYFHRFGQQRCGNKVPMVTIGTYRHFGTLRGGSAACCEKKGEQMPTAKEDLFRFAMSAMAQEEGLDLPDVLRSDMREHLARTDAQGLTLCFASPQREHLVGMLARWATHHRPDVQARMIYLGWVTL